MTAASEPASLRPPPLSLYIHIPWCVRKCPYCDFNSHQQPDTLPIVEYVDALVADLDPNDRLNVLCFSGGAERMGNEMIERMHVEAAKRLLARTRQ